MATSAGGIRAGRAYVELGVKDTLVGGLNKASARLKAFGASVAALGKQFLFISSIRLGALVGASKVFADAGSRLNDMSARTGLSVERLSELDFAAKQTGTSLEDVEASVRKMNKTIGDAIGGEKAAAEALAEIGLSAEQLQKLSVDERFEKIAAGLRNVADASVRGAKAQDIFGRSAAGLTPLINEMDVLTKKARELGLTMSREEATAADDFGDSLDALVAVGKRTVALLGSAFIPQLKIVVQWLINAAKSTAAWLKENQGLVAILLTLAAVDVAVAVGMIALGGVFKIAGVAASVLATGITAVSAAIGFLLTPIGLLIATLGTAGVAFLAFSETGQRALGFLGRAFGVLKADAIAAWKGIGDALAAGDIGLAARVLWTFLKLEWIRGIGFLNEKWLEFKAGFVGIFREAVFAIANLMLHIGFTINDGFRGWFSLIKAGWNSLLTDFKSGLNEIEVFFAKIGRTPEEKQRIEKEGKFQQRDILQQGLDRHRGIAKENKAAIEKSRQERAELQKALKDAQEAEDAQAIARLKGAKDAALDAARAELEQAQNDFKKAREEAAAKHPADLLQGGGPPKKLPDGDEVRKRLSSVGTFQSAALFGLGADEASKKTAKNTEDTVKAVKQVRQAILNTALRFA